MREEHQRKEHENQGDHSNEEIKGNDKKKEEEYPDNYYLQTRATEAIVVAAFCNNEA